MRLRDLVGRCSLGSKHAIRITSRHITRLRRGEVRVCRSKLIAASGLIAMSIFVAPGRGDAQVLPDQPRDLTSLSVDELMNVEVTSVSKKEERLFQTAAAIYVISREDIHRSGMTSVPDLLRMVPGVDVARIDGSKWAISARGFNGRFANKLLVLIDGRSIYSPETSGVYWEVQDLMLEDIDRIEVIRGPGGTLWGANAVNGVINIITKRAQETQGGLITAGGGTDGGFGSLRYGAKLGDTAYYRVYGKYFNRGGLADSAGRDANDGQNAVRGGGRVDWKLSKRDSLTFEGDIYQTNIRETPSVILSAAPFAPLINRPAEFSGGNLLGRWTRAFSDRSDTALQLYYERFSRDGYVLPESLDTFDVDFQHHVALGKRNNLVWGLGWRFVSHEADSSSTTPVQFNPTNESNRLFSIFAQDEITLVKDRLRIMVGSKLEHFAEISSNEPGTFNVEPSVRLSWTPESRQTVWASVSRAVRTLARNDVDIRVNLAAFPGPNGTPSILALLGAEGFKSETVHSYEAGYRIQPRRRLSLDVATFYSVYDHLKTSEPGKPFFEADPKPSHVVIPLMAGNLMRGETYGAETSVNLDVSTAWRLTGSYSFLKTQLHRYAESRDTSFEALGEGINPQHQIQFHSYLKLPRNFELDTSLYHVSRLVAGKVPGYTRLDVRFGWQLTDGLEISAGGQNLLDGRHLEFAGSGIGAIPSQVKRSAYGRIAWRF